MKAHEFMHEMQTTSAILGRTSNISVVFEGDKAKTDGKTIYLPALPQQVDLTQEQVLAMRGYVDHEAGHNRHSDMPRIMSFYDKNKHNKRADLNQLHNSLEDVWMEQRVMDEYPGSLKNLRQGHELIRKREWSFVEKIGEAGAKELLDSTPNDRAGISITCNKGEDFTTTYNEKMRSLLDPKQDAMGKHWADLARKCKDSNEVIELAKKVYQYVDDTPPESQSPQDFDEKAQAGELSELAGEENEGENSPGFDPNGKAEREAAAKGEAKGEGQGSGSKGEGKSSKMKEASKDRGEALTAKDAKGAGGIGECTDNGLRGGYRVYSTESDKYYKRGTTPGNGYSAHVQAVVNDTAHILDYDQRKGQLRADVMVMKNKLRRALMARQQRDWDFGREMGRLDSKRLVAASQGVRQVYKRRTDRVEHDTAISILIDLSGSMGGTKVRVARDCAIALAECFEGTQMKYRIAGFSNNDYAYRRVGSSGQYHRYERLDHSIFKDFDDPLRITRGSIHEIPNAVGGNNSDYDFVSKELYDLSRRPEARKVLFVLSDGNVACRSDAPSSEHQRLIRENLGYYRKRYGVESVGLGIMDSTVKKIYPENVVVNSVNDLSTVVFGKLTEYLFKEV